MKDIAIAGILAAALVACSGAEEHVAPSFSIELLARSPDQHADDVGVHVERAGGSVQLEPGATVRYRIELLAPGDVRLEARASGPGTVEGRWVAIDRAAAAETARDAWTVELEEAGDVVRVFPVPAEGSMLELRIAWRSGAPETRLELKRLALQESTPVERPSVLLISIDTLSARHLSFYGYPLDTAPELRRIAAESFVFENCLTNAPWTVPSFMSLFSGLYPRAHQLASPKNDLWEHWYLAQNRWTMAEFMRAAGYRTAGYVDSPWLTEPFGLVQGYESYDASAGKNAFALLKDLDNGIRKTTAQARAFLEGLSADTPFFLFVHAFDVHGPYVKAPPFEEDSGDTVIYDRDHTAHAGGPVAFGIVPTYIARGEVQSGELPNPMHTAPLERGYDEGIRFTDKALGEFFDYLRGKGVFERTWVIITADHGETMADSSYLFGHGVLDQDVVHIPLLIRPPGGVTGGKRIEETVQLVDVYPTLVELVGSRARHDQLHGRSLMPFLKGETRTPSVVLTETGIMQQSMLVADGWKLVEFAPAKESTKEVLLTYPSLTRAWFAETEERLRKTGADGRPLEKVAAGLFAWKDDLDLQRDFFEAMPATGLTDELFARMQTRKAFQSLVDFIRRGLQGDYHALYDLKADPRAKHDIAAEHPAKVEELKALLARERQRSEQAKENARERAQSLELPVEDIEELKALGYGGSDDE